jgi:transcription-repair coupling factor (superfamily II helicase)
LDYKIQLKNIDKSVVLENVPKDAIGFVLSELSKKHKAKFFMHITTGSFQSEILKKEIGFFNHELKMLLFENWDNLPYDKSSPKLSIQLERIRTLNEIINYSGKEKVLVITTINAVLQKIMPKEVLKKNSIALSEEQKFSIKELEDFLINAGYKKVNTAISMGEFSINNEVADIIIEEEQCYRVKFYRDFINEIRRFNPISQISFDNLQQINLIPVNEIILSKDYILSFKQNYKKLFGMPKKEDLAYEAIANGQLCGGLGNYLSLFYENKLETIFDYLPKETIVTIDKSINEKKIAKLALIKQYYQERAGNIKESLEGDLIYNPLPPELLYLNDEEFKDNLKKFVNIEFNNSRENSNKRIIDLNIKEGKDFYNDSQKNNANVFEELNKD